MSVSLDSFMDKPRPLGLSIVEEVSLHTNSESSTRPAEQASVSDSESLNVSTGQSKRSIFKKFATRKQSTLTGNKCEKSVNKMAMDALKESTQQETPSDEKVLADDDLAGPKGSPQSNRASFSAQQRRSLFFNSRLKHKERTRSMSNEFDDKNKVTTSFVLIFN